MSVRTWIPVLLLAGACTASDKDAETTGELPDPTPALETAAKIAQASYEDSLITAKALDAALSALSADPTLETLTAAKTAWLAAREPYGQTEVFRFQQGPIDADDVGVEGLINSWPLDESWIDYTVGNPNSGIINDTVGYPVIDGAALMAANQPSDRPDGGETSVSTGYHAIEFLLWGQDLSASTAGERPVVDFADSGTANADRRRTYLGVASDLLVADLTTVEAAWKDGATNHRSAWLAGEAEQGLLDLLSGIGSLAGAELSGERMQVALDSQSQEDEHSCFSDNTHRDVVLNARGLGNLWEGRYVRVDGTVVEGTGIGEIVAKADPDADEAFRAALAKAEAALAKIERFDQDMLPGGEHRADIEAAIDGLQEASLAVASSAAAFDLVLNLE
jgi:putative iron-regulated protein